MPGETKHFKCIARCLPVINACNIPQFLACRTQILFITVWDTPGTRIRKQLFYFTSVITFQQISFAFQFGWEAWLSLRKFSINSFTAEGALGPFPPAAINGTAWHVLTPAAASARVPPGPGLPGSRAASPARVLPLSGPLSQFLGREWRTQCQVSSTNYRLQLPSVTFINTRFPGGRPWRRLCHSCVGQMKGALAVCSLSRGRPMAPPTTLL